MAESRTTYSFSFTAISLRPDLARIVADAYLHAGDWPGAKAHVLGTNALQSRSAATGIRMERELRQRLERLTNGQLELLAHSDAGDRAAMSWLAMLKYNPLAMDFAAGLLRDKLAAHDPVLRPSDYETFVDQQSSAHPELTTLTENSRQKVQRVLLRMLFEAGLLATGQGPSLGIIQRPVLSPVATRAIVVDDRRWLAGFLMPDEEVAFT